MLFTTPTGRTKKPGLKLFDLNLVSLRGVGRSLVEGGIDKTPKNARIPDNISLILSLYDSLP